MYTAEFERVSYLVRLVFSLHQFMLGLVELVIFLRDKKHCWTVYM